MSKSFIANQQSRIDLGNLVFDTWAIFWQEFGGFPFDKYTVVFDSNLYWSYSGFGTGMDASFTDHDHIAHEMFHAWNANAIRPNEDEAFWFLEGVAICFNTRMANSTYHYSDALNYYNNYRANYGDKPLSTISMNSDPDTFGFASMKGFLVGFLLDLTLSQKGHHLGEIHNELYHRYGTKPSDSYPFTNEDILDAVNEVTGENFSGFFNDYVYGTRALPLSYNSYEYICHGNPHLLSFGLPTPFIPILLLND